MLKRYLAPYQAAVAAAGSSLNPKAEPLQPQRSSSPGTSTQPAPPADLMDLSSPPKEIPPKSQLSVDLDFMLEEVRQPVIIYGVKIVTLLCEKQPYSRGE